MWNVSFHINADASYLVGTDTFDGHSVTFRPGPIWLCAERGGFGILDEINMAKNEALAVLHAALDFRRSLDVPGYKKQDLRPETRFIATMNYGYAGTRDLNEALTSRFAVLDMPLITEDNFQKLISRRYPAIRVPIRDQFVRLYTELERKDLILSNFDVSRQDEALLLDVNIHSIDKLRQKTKEKTQNKPDFRP